MEQLLENSNAKSTSQWGYLSSLFLLVFVLIFGFYSISYQILDSKLWDFVLKISILSSIPIITPLRNSKFLIGIYQLSVYALIISLFQKYIGITAFYGILMGVSVVLIGYTILKEFLEFCYASITNDSKSNQNNSIEVREDTRIIENISVDENEEIDEDETKSILDSFNMEQAINDISEHRDTDMLSDMDEDEENPFVTVQNENDTGTWETKGKNNPKNLLSSNISKHPITFAVYTQIAK